MVISVQLVVFWVRSRYRCFGGIYCLHHQYPVVTTHKSTFWFLSCAVYRLHKDHLASPSSLVTILAQFSFLLHQIHWCQLVWSLHHSRSEQLAPRVAAHTSRVLYHLLLSHPRFVKTFLAPSLFYRCPELWWWTFVLFSTFFKPSGWLISVLHCHTNLILSITVCSTSCFNQNLPLDGSAVETLLDLRFFLI
jgi:hypothetical protein